jgi:creatinine amidohydrolase
MKWTELVPSEFSKLIKEDALCVVPMGSLERHGEHIPFGCDMTVAETVAEQASRIVPSVVFPGYYLAQVHEAACFTGTVNLPQAMAVEVLSKVLDGIASNGFKKIVILNGHGGNNAFLDYFAMSQLDEPRDYVLYILNAFGLMTEGEEKVFNSLWETAPLGHACEMETSIYMACRPGLVRLDLVSEEPALPLGRFEHLRPKGIHNAHWWYADFPQNVVGLAGKATEEKGRKALEILVASAARALQTIKEDTTAPALQKEFLEKVKNKKQH